MLGTTPPSPGYKPHEKDFRVHAVISARRDPPDRYRFPIGIGKYTISGFTGYRTLRDSCHIQFTGFCPDDDLDPLKPYILPGLTALNGFRANTREGIPS